jgi:uncharacterized repeat protein (TIGR01451 family)
MADRDSVESVRPSSKLQLGGRFLYFSRLIDRLWKSLINHHMTNLRKTVMLFGIGLLIAGASQPATLNRIELSNGQKVIGASGAADTQAPLAYAPLPLYFIQNTGQVNQRVKFYEKGSGHATYFTQEGVYLDLFGAHRAATKTSNPSSAVPPLQQARLHLLFLGADKDPKVTADGLLKGRINYFIGRDPKEWKTNISAYQAVVYKEIYPGIDLKFYGNNRQMEYDIIIKPGADPSKVRFSYEGIEDLRLSERGDLVIGLTEDQIIQKKPHVYQVIHGKRQDVAGRFRLFKPQPPISNPQFAYGFEVASYDRRYPLIVDPTLVYSTYLGGSDDDAGRGIAVDASGDVYVTGQTNSLNFPATPGAYDSSFNGGFRDVIVAKLNPAVSGSASLLYATYVGGSDDDSGRAIAVDADGNAYVTGYTRSSDLPTTLGVFDPTYHGNFDAFLFKLNASGSGLVYSTYLGGSDSDFGYGITVDDLGHADVTGQTASADYPTTATAFQGSLVGSNGNGDAFVTELDDAGVNLLYSTFLGGADWDTGYGIAVDPSGKIYVAGHTGSIDFPTTLGAYDTSPNGDFDAFVAKLDPMASGPGSLVYSTYLGGSGSDAFFGGVIAIDDPGNAYVAGNTSSGDFPVTFGAYDPLYNGNGDLFVAKLDATGANLLYATYLGGSGSDQNPRLAVDASGNAYVSGDTDSLDFPTTETAVDRMFSGGAGTDVVVAKLDTNGSSLLYATYLGGGDIDTNDGIAVDAQGNVYVTGLTYSNDFPTTTGAFDSSFNGGYFDGFVTKIGLGADLSITKNDSPDPVLAGNPLTYTITVTNSGPNNATNVTVTDTLPGGVTFVSAVGTDWVCQEASGVVTCTRSSLAVDVAPVITIVVTPTAAGGVDNTVDVTGDETDPAGSNNSDSVTTTVNPLTSADLSITKTDSPDPVLVVDNLTYTITVTNNGPSPATDVTVTDTLPGSVTFVSATPSQGTPCTGTSTVSCNLGTVTNGANATVMIVVKPNTEGLISNTATVAGNETDPVSGNDTSPPQETTVNPVPSGGPLNGNPFSSGGGLITSTMYQLVPGVVGQSVTGTGLSSTNYQIEAGFAPVVIAGAFH